MKGLDDGAGASRVRTQLAAALPTALISHHVSEYREKYERDESGDPGPGETHSFSSGLGVEWFGGMSTYPRPDQCGGVGRCGRGWMDAGIFVL
jgi:hypothetical protein